MEKLFYNINAQEYSESQQIAVPDNCNGMTLINRGDGIVYVNNIPLSPNPTPGAAGEAVSIGGNVGEYYNGRLTVNFAAQTIPLLIVIFKYYVNPNYA